MSAIDFSKKFLYFFVVTFFISINLFSMEESIESSLFKAVKDNDMQKVKLLIKNCVDVNFDSNIFHNPIHLSVLNCNKEMLQLLIDNGLNVDLKNFIGRTGLHLAVEKGYKEIVKLLIDSGANVNAKACYGETPLSLAINFFKEGRKNDYLEIIKILIDNNVEVNLKVKYLNKPIYSASSKNLKGVIELLVLAGASFEEIMLDYPEMYTIAYGVDLIEAVKSNNTSKALKIIYEHLAFDFQDKLGNTALHYAVLTKNKRIIVAILSRNQNSLMIRNNKNELPIEISISFGEPWDILKAFVDLAYA